MYRNSLDLWVVFTFTALCLIFAGCAPTDVSIQIDGGVPADQLSYYADSFDAPKRDLWEIAAFSQSGQLRNFKMADVAYEGGRLKIQTQTGAFSSAVVTSKFILKGDFDIQIDCQIQFLKHKVNFDQLLYFEVIEQGKTFQASQSAVFVINKRYDMGTGIIGAIQRRTGEYVRGNLRQIDGFYGTLRLVRTDDRITMFYRKQGSSSWRKLDTLLFTKDNVAVLFALHNFITGRTAINATEPVIAYFDNFRINAAGKVIEKEI